ncbi:MAG: methylmalonyl-CoA mutase family protein [Thermodesulfobacteriota bacterium]|nr:methylmalonyl-CoA mutase family protein [Thermodesulfobacteriota bacterium]
MYNEEELKKIQERRKQWEDVTLKKGLERYRRTESPQKFFTPLDVQGFNFLEKVGFPGEYPFTAGIYPATMSGIAASAIMGRGSESPGIEVRRAGAYSGYGTAENSRDFYRAMQARGWSGGPNIAFDLPTQCGYDSDDPVAEGEVGKVGVAVDTLRDFEVIFEAFTDGKDLDKIASNFTINAPANIIMAMYFALAEQRGVPLDNLVATPQNDILKEILARGTYIFPIKHSMRMVRDSIVYCTEHAPRVNYITVAGYHIREAGATGPQAVGFTLANAMAYIQLGIDAGLDVERFYPRLTFLGFGGSMEVLKEIALGRAARRIWAKIMREKFKVKNPRCWILRPSGGIMIGNSSTTVQRPLNNLIRTVIGGVCSGLAGGAPSAFPPYDEPLGLGWSLEAQQLSEDASRIMIHEARLCDVLDPFAGSYFMESLTDQQEREILEVLNKIDDMGGAVATIESGYMQREIARSAHEFQRQIETGEKIVVGVNAFMGENELEVDTSRMVAHPYDPKKRAEAEHRQLENLAKVKKERDNDSVKACLKRLEEAARDESVNLMPLFIELVKLYATEGEMCGVLRKVFGEYHEYGAL